MSHAESKKTIGGTEGIAYALTDRELAKMLGVSLPKLQEELRRGNIPGARKIGRYWRINRKVFEAWWNGEEVTS